MATENPSSVVFVEPVDPGPSRYPELADVSLEEGGRASVIDAETASAPEPQGWEAWMRYDETTDYKMHSSWASASQQNGWRSKCKWAGYKVADGADRVGGFFADLFGITQSRYQDVIDSVERMEDQAKEDRDNEKERLAYMEKLEADELKRLEGGESAGADGEGSRAELGPEGAVDAHVSPFAVTASEQRPGPPAPVAAPTAGISDHGDL